MFISWWYGEMLTATFSYFKHLLAYLYDFFSVKICLTTLFSVWRRDTVTYDGPGFNIKAMFESMVLNLASVIVGFCVKLGTLLTYLIMIAIFFVLMSAYIIFWIFFPLIIVALIYFGLKYSLGLF
ncbi:MAG: hypothetical protein WCI57_02130 [Candidatus Berkelbacteria bacterium]